MKPLWKRILSGAAAVLAACSLFAAPVSAGWEVVDVQHRVRVATVVSQCPLNGISSLFQSSWCIGVHQESVSAVKQSNHTPGGVMGTHPEAKALVC